ncbi:MAG: hypothetical protein ACE5JK_05645 [Candidatus Omnitrophota bacterium]
MEESFRQKEKGLEDEIKDFETERENVRKIIGRIGGVPTPKARLVNLNHFQFWILSSLEWRLDQVDKRLKQLLGKNNNG